MKFKDALREAGRAYLERVLIECRGKVEAAAVVAGLNSKSLYRMAPKYGVDLRSRPYRKRSETPQIRPTKR